MANSGFGSVLKRERKDFESNAFCFKCNYALEDNIMFKVYFRRFEDFLKKECAGWTEGEKNANTTEKSGNKRTRKVLSFYIAKKKR